MIENVLGTLSGVLHLIVVVGILVFVHELGHFLAAKYFRVRVETFSVGFGPRLWGFRRGETDYRVSAIPLGGYVKMTGESDADSGPRDDGNLLTKPRWQRLIIMLGGPAMNLLLAVCVWWGLFMYGSEVPDIPQGPPVVEALEQNSPAAEAGMRSGDAIVAIAGAKIDDFEDYDAVYTRTILFSPGKTLPYTVLRDGRRETVDVTLGQNPVHGVGFDGVRLRFPILIRQVVENSPAQAAGFAAGDRLLSINGRIPGGPADVSALVAQAEGHPLEVRVLRNGETIDLTVTPRKEADGVFKIGVYPDFPRKFVRYGPLAAAGAAIERAAQDADLLFRTLSNLVTRKIGLQVMSGPIEIARISRDTSRAGLMPLLIFLATFSLQLGLINLLPIPVLDGGHILILLIEGGMRRDLSAVLKERVLQAGLVFLLVLMATMLSLDVYKQVLRSSTPPAVTQPTE